VVFPAPVGPTTPMRSPFLIVRSIRSNADVWTLEYLKAMADSSSWLVMARGAGLSVAGWISGSRELRSASTSRKEARWKRETENPVNT
jgi:hypothetical protein